MSAVAASQAAPASPSRSLAATALLVATLALLAAFNLRAGFDVFDFVNGDTLYPVQMLDFGILDYRPPPPNRVFPDVAAHWAAAPFFPDPLEQKLAVGIGLFALTVLAVGLFRGLPAMALFSAILASNGFEFLVSASHYSLPLTVLIYLLSHGRRWEAPVLFALVFFNPLILLPLAFLLVEPAAMRRHAGRGAAVAAALALNTAYSEFSATLVQIVGLFPLWYAAVWLARRLGFRFVLMTALCVALPVLSAAGLMPARYGVPVAASLLLMLFPARRPAFDWRYLAFPAAASAIFLATADWTRHDRMTAAYDCLVEELAARGIKAVAAGHWTAKPLYFAAKRAGAELTLTQTDFSASRSHPWMAPHSFYGEPTHWAVRDEDTCALIDPSAVYCGQATVAPVAGSVRLCGAFELFRYATPVPAAHDAVPAGKIEAIARNLGHYVSAAAARLR